ncbi:hypothetical protein EDC15_12317 [Acetobacter aceti NBRC 14818]|nr:hypothetical protein EDC15_12317 [Acetobacter aceti NBRC 14818]
MTKIWSGKTLQTCAYIFHGLRSRCPTCGLRLQPFFTDMAKLFIDTFCFDLTLATRQRWITPSPNFGTVLITRLTCGSQGHFWIGTKGKGEQFFSSRQNNISCVIIANHWSARK